MERIVLASASPRRKQLLSEMGPKDFLVFPVDIEEKLHHQLSQGQQVMEIACQKATMAFQRYQEVLQKKENLKGPGQDQEFIILGADTLVFWRGRALGKPKDSKQARYYLKCLSGSWHEVLTSLCLIRNPDKKIVKGVERSKVLFRTLTEKEISTYIQSGEPMDKAGAYGIQGLGGSFVQQVHGNMDNVVGLPRGLLLNLMKKMDLE